MGNNNYYNEHAPEYIESSIDVDLTHLYEVFLHYVPIGGSILDAGCGSGRDLLYFKNLHYNSYGFDNSVEMVQRASLYSGCKVDQLGFEEIEYTDQFDAIWACASLLHVEKELLESVFIKLHRALHKGGVLYCSFKNREEDFSDGERNFTCFTEKGFEEFIERISLFSIETLFITEDARKERKGEMWMNAILRAT